MSPPAARVGNNLVLASILALLSYAPFEYVAKGTLIVCGILFVFDPFPLARLVAIICVLLVGVLTRAYKSWNISGGDEAVTIVSDSDQPPLESKKNE